jgi:GT2 family glycosyltransferase
MREGFAKNNQEVRVMLKHLNLPLVSVIILNFNGKDFLGKCVSSVMQTKYPNFEVLVVDNSSTDDSLTLVESSFGNDKRLKTIKNAVNLGYAGGNNVGFGYSNGSYVVFLNNDTVVDPHWLTHLVYAFEDDKTIGLAQSLLLAIDGKEIQTAGWLFSDYLMFTYSMGARKPAHTKFQSIFEVSFATGAAMMVERKLVDEIGLFESGFPFYYDDTLLSLKTWLAGKRVVTISEARVFHAGGEATRGELNYFTIFNLLRAKVCLIFDVCYKLTYLAKAIFIFAFSLQYDLIYSVFKRQPLAVSAHIHALGWVFRNFGNIWQNRLKHWSKAKISSEALLSRFIRITLPTSVYLLPFPRRKKYCETAAKEYENECALA